MNTETLQTICQTAIALGLLLTALGGYGAYHFGQILEREKDAITEKEKKTENAKRAYTGVLEPPATAMPTDQLRAFPRMEIGDSGTIFVWGGPQGQALFKFADENGLVITRDNKSIKVSTIIRDQGGRVVAELNQNEWKVNPNDTWDRNYSENALEVKDASGDIVLQVPDRIQIQAKLYNSSGQGFGLGKSPGPKKGALIEFTGPNHPKLMLKIEPLFKYPSALHLGEFK